MIPAVGQLKGRLPGSSEEEQEVAENDDKSEIKELAEHIVHLFQEPLEAKGACLSSLDNKIEEVVDFYQLKADRKYIDQLQDDQTCS